MVSASELDFNLEDSQTTIDDSNIGTIDDSLNQLEDISSEEEISSENEESEGNSHSIYVGKNITTDGNGSKENPYNNLDLVQSNYGETSDKIIINMFEGTYFIGSELTFKTNDLKINSVNGTVILKNLYNEANKKEAIYLTTSGANFTMSNITFDMSDFTIKQGKNNDFSPFRGNGYSNVVYDNCVFIGINVLTEFNDKNNNILFERCSFISSQKGKFLYYSVYSNITFRYCKFLAGFEGIASASSPKENSVIYDSNWFGQNSITKTYFFTVDGAQRYKNFACYSFTRYAILEVSESYLGDDKYEIFGQLMWNDSTTDNIDQLGPMTVYLSADSGDIPETVIMKNGTFKVTYVAQSDNHKITISLDNQNITINNNVNFTLDSPITNYGDKQNITVTFNDNINGTVYIIVNNKTYYKYCDNQNNITIDIDDVLSKGSYDVSVNFVSDKILYRPTEINAAGIETTNYRLFGEIDNVGFNSTKLIVLGFDSKINIDNESDVIVVTLTDSEGIPIKGATVTYNTTSGVEGFNVTGNDGKFNIIGLNGEFTINVTYAGNESNNPSNKSASFNFKLPAVKTTLTINSTEKGIVVITVVDNENKPIANLEVKYSINKGANSTNTTGADGTISIPVTGEGEIKAYFEGNEAYLTSENSYKYNFTETTPDTNGTSTGTGKTNTNKQTTTKKVTKKATKITASKKTFKAKTKTKKYTITLKAGKTAVKKVKVTIKIGKKTYKATTNSKGKATFKITKLTKKGKYTAVIKFAGNKNYKATNKKVKITVKK